MNYFIIDGLNLAYRAHNANFELSTAAGAPSGMFYGFIRTLFSLKRKYRGYKFSVLKYKIATNPCYYLFFLQEKMPK